MTKTALFIDPAVSNYEPLLAGIPHNTEIYLLSPDTDGVLQIADILKKHANLDSIQILSHGASGALFLGSSALTGDTLDPYSVALSQIGASLSENGDILLYGCNVAQGDAGSRFIDGLARHTGADVAASDDVTGQGGDWVLEAGTGRIDAAPAIDENAGARYAGTLAKTYPGGGNGITANRASATYYDEITEGSPDASITNLLNGGKWGGGFGQGVSLYVSFSNANSTYKDSWPGHVQDFSAVQITGARGAVAAWAAVADITLTETTDSATNAGDIRWAQTGASLGTAYTYYPAATAGAGDIWLGPYYPNDYGNPVVGGFGYLTYLHELGHALGLAHPHDGPVAAEPGEDQVKYTVMSYLDYAGDSFNGYRSAYLPTTPMLNDILTIQFLYGANTVYHSGNDTYRWAADERIYQTLWDAGGTDTIDASNQAQGTYLNLNCGQWSQIGVAFSNSQAMVRDCLTIAYGTTIENALGSAFADTLIGNDAANALNGGSGNDTLKGGVGNDTLSGGDGNDFYQFNVGDGADRIMETTGTDQVVFGPGITVEQITGALANGKVTLKIGNSDSLDFASLGDGTYSIEQFKFSDGRILASAWVTSLLDTLPDNAAPALTGTATTLPNATEDTPYVLTATQLLSGWTDADNDPLGIAGLTTNHGTLSASNNGGYTLTPAANYNGQVTLSYNVTDGRGASVAATRDLGVVNVNDLPTGTVTISDTTPEQGQTLTAMTTLSDADGLGTIRYQWQANNVNIAVGNTYTVTSNELGKTLRVIASYTDELGQSESVSSPNTSAVTAPAAFTELFQGSTTGWRIESFPDGNTGTIATYGVELRDGCLHVADPDSGTYYFATKNIANPGTYYGGYLTYRFSNTGIGISFDAPDLIVSGGGLRLGYMGDIQPANDTFADYKIPLFTTDKWYVMGNIGVYPPILARQATASDFATVLGGGTATSLAIRGEFISGSDETYLARATLHSARHPLAGAVNLTGTAGNDLLNGSMDNDILRGMAGNDLLNGGAGADNMVGGPGNDRYGIDNIGDRISETSTLATEIDQVNSSISYTLGANLENLTLTGTAAINGTGNALPNVLTGNAAANSLIGSGGNDKLAGNGGNDRLNGGSGNDTLTGGAGSDIFKLTTLPKDTLTDFSPTDDKIQLENSVFTSFTATGLLDGTLFRIGAAAADANDYLIYNKTTGALFYDADGNGTGATMVQIAVLGANLSVTHANFAVI